MNKLRKLDRSPIVRTLCLGAIFALMLVLNVLTPLICDDFTYNLNFLTKEPLGGFFEIFESMYAHSYKMNGRLISHGLAQVFMLLPSVVFDVVNAAVFTLTLWLLHRLCGSKSALLLASSFCLLWMNLPVFGQVVLWQVGAINYFWSLTALLLFIAPELLRLREDRKLLKKKWHYAAFCIYGFFFGWYNEIASFVGIVMVPCLILLGRWLNADKLSIKRFTPPLFAVFGYLVMLSMPAQAANKSGGLTMELLAERLGNCFTMLQTHCGFLLLLVCLLASWCTIAKVHKKAILGATLLAVAGICANFMPIAASYYPERCLCTTVLLLIMAIVWLARELVKTKAFPVIAAGAALIAVLTIPSGISGCRDILSCYRQNELREQTIATAIESGDTDVTANVVIPLTPWSGYWDLRDLSTEDPETWPNHSMAVYYGIDSIIGE